MFFRGIVSLILGMCHLLGWHGYGHSEGSGRPRLAFAQDRSCLSWFFGFGRLLGFIQGFGVLAALLTRLLKKESFMWSDEAQQAFQALQHAITLGPILQLLDFEKDFVVECDASGLGFGDVLHQVVGPLTFFSEPITPHHTKLAAYKCELIGLVQAVRHWRAYVWGRSFLVRIDHYSLNFLLDQRLSTIPQHAWVSKFLGFDFRAEYKPRRSNVVADALSRRDAKVGMLLALSTPTFSLFDALRREGTTDPTLVALKDQVNAGLLEGPWSWREGLLLYTDHIYVPPSSLLPEILATAHTPDTRVFTRLFIA